MNRGIVFSATGRDHVDEAIQSAQYVKNHMPDIKITLFSDREVSSNVIDDVQRLESPSYDYGDSVLRESMIQHDKNLFLDTDTYLLDSVDEIFEILDRFDVAAAHNLHRNVSTNRRTNYFAESVPDAFPQYNSGVIAYANNDNVRKFIQTWQTLYEQNMPTEERYNQPTFREALYKSTLQIATLTSEYNMYYNYPSFVDSKVKILHGNPDADIDPSTIAEKVNRTYEARVCTKQSYPIRIVPRSSNESLTYKTRTLPYQVENFLLNIQESLQNEGVVSTIRKGVSKLF